MSTMTLEPCKTCGSKETSWNCAPINNGQAVDGRLCMREVGVQFYRGCDRCSETLEVIGTDEFLARLNAHLAQPAQAVDQAVDVGAIQWVIDYLEDEGNACIATGDKLDAQWGSRILSMSRKLARAISNKKE